MPGFVPCGIFNSNCLFSSVVTSITQPVNKSNTFTSFIVIRLSWSRSQFFVLLTFILTNKLPRGYLGCPLSPRPSYCIVSPCFAPAGTSTVTVSSCPLASWYWIIKFLPVNTSTKLISAWTLISLFRGVCLCCCWPKPCWKWCSNGVPANGFCPCCCLPNGLACCGWSYASRLSLLLNVSYADVMFGTVPIQS